jgi:hypothetical protein
MNNRYKSLIAGFGSIIAIGPSNSYAEFIPNQDPKERMKSHWQDTGNHMRKALGKYHDEQKQK